MPAFTSDPSPPVLSVVIASVNGRPYLDACLAALERQEGELAAEVLVADCVGPEVVEYVRSEHPETRVIPFDEPKSVPELRSAGILASRGRIVAITEDHCIPEPRWYLSMVESHRHHAEPAVGGAVDNAAVDRIVDWAVYFCEYSSFMSPVPAGPAPDLPGPNVSYKREVLEDLDDLIRDGYWETFLHWRLQELGHELVMDPAVRVLHRKHFRFLDFLRERFHYGRAFAGNRNRFVSAGRRWTYFLLSPLLPPVLVLRIGRRVWSRKRNLGAFAASLPLIGAFMLAWAAGEWVGYALGPGKSSLQLT